MAKKKNRGQNLSPEFWERFDETTRRLLERIEYYRKKAAAERAARSETRPDITG
jgi:hypothetical protein